VKQDAGYCQKTDAHYARYSINDCHYNPAPGILFEFGFDKRKFKIIGIDDIMLNTCFAKVGDAGFEFDDGLLAPLTDNFQVAIHHRYHNIIKFMAMPAGGCTWRKPPLSNPRAPIINEDGCYCIFHFLLPGT
jgi:hypothetical protein